MKMRMRIVAAVCMVAAFGGIIKVFGLEDVIFFNKGISFKCSRNQSKVTNLLIKSKSL
jgi:hypothetical protein